MTQTSAVPEQTVVSNEFGTVSSRRVVYNRNKTWLSGGSREDIPLQHITSVRLETSRSVVIGVLILLIGGGLLVGPTETKVIGLVLVAFAILLLWGSPAVIVNTAGRDLNASSGLPWSWGSANAFVTALRSQLFDKT